MKLNKSDRAKDIEIKSPKWTTREILIATFKVMEHNVITFTDAAAKKHYPDQYYISGANIRKYPVWEMPTKTGHIRVYLVSLDELIVYEGRK